MKRRAIFGRAALAWAVLRSEPIAYLAEHADGEESLTVTFVRADVARVLRVIR